MPGEDIRRNACKNRRRLTSFYQCLLLSCGHLWNFKDLTNSRFVASAFLFSIFHIIFHYRADAKIADNLRILNLNVCICCPVNYVISRGQERQNIWRNFIATSFILRRGSVVGSTMDVCTSSNVSLREFGCEQSFLSRPDGSASFIQGNNTSTHLFFQHFLCHYGHVVPNQSELLPYWTYLSKKEKKSFQGFLCIYLNIGRLAFSSTTAGFN